MFPVMSDSVVEVLTAKVADVAPAAIVTDAGADALALAELSATGKPPVGAALLMVTVPVEAAPPRTELGFNVNAVKVGGVTVRVALAEAPFAEAPMLTEAFDATATVVTVNVAVVAPAATVTLAGTVALALLEVSATESPPVAAAELIVTVPVDVAPPSTDVGFNVTPVTSGPSTVSVAVTEVVPVVAVIVSVLFVPTAVVETVKVPVVAPAATVTVAGTVADGSLEDKATERPPVGAAPFSVTVPLEDVPPLTVVGFRASFVATGGWTVNAAETGVPLLVAVIFPVVLDPTGVVVTVNVPVVAPAAIVTVAGTVAAELVDARLTVSPPVGAGSLVVTVPVEEAPPTTEVGLSDTLFTTWA
jgi:hypothetical protein